MLSDDLHRFLTEWHNDSPTMEVQTSGSTGTPKRLSVSKVRMLASARMTCDTLGLQAGDTALLCMPLDYIAGKMMVVRSLERNMRLLTNEPSTPAAGHPPVKFAAMVPLQVYRLLQHDDDAAWLRSIPHLLLGGGAIDKDLEATLRTFPHAVWSSYGMTETLSHIALRRLSGPDADSWYTPLQGISVSTDAEGCLIIHAPAVCQQDLLTRDMAEVRPDGHFRILGRKDNVVCSGGIKIQIEEVEEKLRPLLGDTFCLTHRHDAAFGEALVILTTKEIPAGAFDTLSRYHKPKYTVMVEELPRTKTGKIDRKKACKIAQTA